MILTLLQYAESLTQLLPDSEVMRMSDPDVTFPSDPATIDETAALDRFLELTKIPATSGEELPVAQAIQRLLAEAGVAESQMRLDDANSRTRLSGNCGNLVVHLPGSGKGATTLLSAHMDTVPICKHCEPAVEGDVVRSAADTGLGADDRSGVAAVVTALIERIRLGDAQFPPAVAAFLIQEEIGLEGARCLDTSVVGPVDRAFNFDGGASHEIRHGAIGGERIDVCVRGMPAHAGVAPETGVSAIVISSLAIAELAQKGWLGKVVHESGEGTANVGIIQGGDATNVITPEVTLRAEARSHDAAMRTRIVREMKSAFESAASQVKNTDGDCGSIEFASHVDYDSFLLPDDHPSIEFAAEAIRTVGRTPVTEVANGGLDANWLYRHGIEAVTLGSGQRNIHTADEVLDIPRYLDACRMATWLITRE
ncbi:MAG: M20/M25/M40 family metallo-hydrolase [Planctomycetota bacterium]